MTQTTSGIEPLFQPYYIRRKKGNPGDVDFRSDFIDESGDHWMEYPVLHPQFKNWILYMNQEADLNDREYIEKMYQKSPWFGSTANDINWIKRVEIQSIIQKYTTHSISSTINLPEDVTKEKVANIYIESWKKGLKGVTVYRDGCRTGVLVNNKTNKFQDNDSPKREESLLAHVYHTSASGNRYTVIICLFENKPYEVFIIPGHRGKQTKEAKLIRVAQGEYNLEIQNGAERIYSDMTETMLPEHVVISRLLSWGLRHGGGVKHAVEQMLKSPSDNMFSFVRVLTRILKTYIPDGEKSKAKCFECGSTSVIYTEGCERCLECGSSKCG